MVIKQKHSFIQWLQIALLSVCMMVAGAIIGWQAAHTEKMCISVVTHKVKSIPARLRGEPESATDKARQRIEKGIDAVRELGNGA